MSLTPSHVPTVPATTDRDRALNGVFTTALEGGIGYWSAAERYYWSTDGGTTEARDFIAVVRDTESDDHVAHVIDRDVITLGISRLYGHMRDFPDSYHHRAVNALHFGKWEDADYDSDTADLVVQYGLFGEQVYA